MVNRSKSDYKNYVFMYEISDAITREIKNSRSNGYTVPKIDYPKTDIQKWKKLTGIEVIEDIRNIKNIKDLEQPMIMKKNWDMMSKLLKTMSDKKSIEVYGKTNEIRFYDMINKYIRDIKKIDV